MEPAPQQRTYRATRANGHVEGGASARRAHHGNKRWVADGRSNATTSHAGSDSERWERGGYRGGGRGRARGGRGKFPNASVTFRRNGALDGGATGSEGEHSEMEEDHLVDEADPNEAETPEERERFWQELVKTREVERKKAIAEGKMDDPLKPKRLEDAITMVGTCMDMCPRFERYRRERENNLFEWETIPGTKRVDHKRAVKAYERAAGDKTLPSDLRPPHILKLTLDYLFHELLPHGGFSETFNFIRDRSRAVRNDFTMQHEMGPIAIECHDRCARFHVLALHMERDRPGFSIAMEEQQLMNTLQSLKEFYLDQRSHYQSPTELEMRVYHRLVHIRDQKERHDDIPQALLNHPVFELTTRFRARVQAKSAPITKTSPLTVDADAMHIFAELADVLRREGNVVMTYLVACILERHFGKDTIEDIESIRGDLSYSDIIDGYSGTGSQEQDTDIDISVADDTEDQAEPAQFPRESPKPLQPSGTQWPIDTFGPKPTESAFFPTTTTGLPSEPSAPPRQSAFSNLKTTPNAFGTTAFGAQSVFINVAPTTLLTSVFGRNRGNEAESVPTSLPHQVTETSNTFAGFSTSSAASSFSPFPPESLAATFTSHAEQLSQSTSSFSPKAPQANGWSSGTAFSSEASPLKTLSPLAPTFTPKLTRSTSIGFNGFATSTSSAIPITPPDRIRTSTENRSPSAPGPVSVESSGTIPSRPTQGRSDTIVTEVPFFSSPPSQGSTSLEGRMDQTPPLHPPPLDRHQPISLPPTPTATMFISSSLPQSRKSSLKNLQTSSLSVPNEILSPLVLHSPVSRSSIPALLRKESTQSPLKAATSVANIEAEAEPTKLNASVVTGAPPAEKPSFDIMNAMALDFVRRGWLVKRMFSKWRQRVNEQVKWIEACRRSARYKEKVHAERLSRSADGPPTSNGRTRRMPSESRTPLKKRLRARLSGEHQPPANDEELARRFEKNHEEHARRWARGSFLSILKNSVESTSRPLPDNWSAWLSLNQESDGTAIWLEQKFDVPHSGRWKNENVFQIPISQKNVELAHSFPGIIIFERTPLTGVTDILRRKYRVLEDCTRLREIIEEFPSNRHYVPALLCVAWSERDSDSSKDFDDMVESMVDGGMLRSAHELMISMSALDMESKLEELLHIIPFDLEGQLVKRVSLNDLFKTWEHQWEEMTTRRLDNCNSYGEFNWDLYAKLLEDCIRILVRLINSVTVLLRDDVVSSNLAGFQLVKNMNSDAMFDAVLGWLRALPKARFTASLTNDIRGHQSLGRAFPTTTFLSQLYALARSVAAHVADIDPEATHDVTRSRVDDVTREFQVLASTFEEDVNASYIVKPKPSKRAASFAETNSSRISSPRSKKQRLSSRSPSDEESTSPDSLTSPPLSIATSVLSEPGQPTIVTSAMLRSLTKDIRVKYGAVQTNALSSSGSR